MTDMHDAHGIARTRGVTLEGLGWFVRAAEAGSLSRAATRAHAAQSTVSRAVARLEAAVGVSLFHRSARAFALTDAGAALLPIAREVLASLESFGQGAAFARGGAAGVVRLSLCTSLGRHVLLPALLAWARGARRPSLDVRFEEHDVDPRSAEIDVVVRAGRPHDLDVMRTRLGEYGHVLVASPRWVHKHGSVGDPAELASLPTIAIRLERVWSTWVFVRDKERTRVSVRPWLSVSDADALAEAALEGAGATVLPDYLAREPLRRGALVTLSERYTLPPIPVFAFHAPRRKMPALAARALDVMTSALAA